MAGNFLKNTSGGFSTVAALTMFGVVLAGGAAMDISRTMVVKNNAQNALDAATLATAKNRADEVKARTLGKDTFDRSLAKEHVEGYNVSFSFGEEETYGSATADVDMIFGSFLPKQSVRLNLKSTVALNQNSNERYGRACIIALAETERQGILMNSDANVDVEICDIDVHSVLPPSIVLNARAKVTANRLCIAGTALVHTSEIISNLETGCVPDPDPYAGMFPTPPESSCDYQNGNFNELYNELQPGRYCGHFNFNNSNAVNHLAPGTYVFDKSSWNVNGGTFEGEGVTFYFLDDNSGIQFNSSVKAYLRPPTSGDYQGAIFLEESGLGKRNFVFNDSDDFDIEGLIYLPSKKFIYNSHSTFTSKKMVLVAHTFIFNKSHVKLSMPDTLSPIQSDDTHSGGYYIKG